MNRFADQFAIVTGGGGGIGSAICRALAGDGASVWAVGRTAATLARTIGDCNGRSRAYVADLADEAQVAALARDACIERRGLDLLVHAAGTLSPGAAADSTVAGFDAQYA